MSPKHKVNRWSETKETSWQRGGLLVEWGWGVLPVRAQTHVTSREYQSIVGPVLRLVHILFYSVTSRLSSPTTKNPTAALGDGPDPGGGERCAASAPGFGADHVRPSWGDWQDLFTGGETRRKGDGKRGNLRESDWYTERECKFFYLARVFKSFYVSLPHRFLLTGHETLTSRVFCWFFNSIADTGSSFVLDELASVSCFPPVS